MVGIPQRRTPSDVEIATVDPEAVHVPEGVVALETAINRLDVAALLDGRLPGPDNHLLQAQVMGTEQGSLAPELPIFNHFHIS